MIGLYARVSTQEQAERYSIQEQLDRMEKYCQSMGWQQYEHYIDPGFSGANIDRPGLQKLIQDAQGRRLTKVIVYKLDRLSRSQKDTLVLIEDVFLANNVDFVSISESFDTSSPFGRAMLGTLAVFAQLEREQIRERMTMGKQARAKLGKYKGGGNPPSGYIYKDGKLQVVEQEAEQIKEAYRMYADGASIGKIIDHLNSTGGKQWAETTMYHVLENRAYLGETYHKGQWYPGEHDPIIDPDLFEKVQEAIKRRRYTLALPHNQGKAQSPLGGYLVCGLCGQRYNKHQQTSYTKGKRYSYPYYICKGCTENKNWRQETLDRIIFDQIRQLQFDSTQPTTRRPALIRQEIAKLSKRIDRLLELYSMEEMPLESIQAQIKTLTDKQSGLEVELLRIESEATNRQYMVDVTKRVGEILDSGDLSRIRNLIDILIDHIVLTNDDVEIHWNFTP